jgi:2-haloalkanoic acid dehalogenase type II
MQRWTTFDCYGTLIDWNGGIGRELERLFGVSHAARLLHSYHEVEPRVQREEPGRSYRDVLAVTLARLAEQEGLPLDAGEHDALARSLPEWGPFAEVRESLEEARGRGWKLAILSNTDRDFIDASMERIGIQFELAIVASEIGSYKPAHRHWDAFFERTGADRAGHVHVAASLYHDIAPACELGLRSIWINRLGEEAEPQPDVELHTLAGLGDALDSLVA